MITEIILIINEKIKEEKKITEENNLNKNYQIIVYTINNRKNKHVEYLGKLD